MQKQIFYDSIIISEEEYVMDEGKGILTAGGKEAGYLFEFKPEGVFLTVYPS